jgi:hypothetical protein
MTVKKALKIIDYIIDKKLQAKIDVLSLDRPWNQGSTNLIGLSEAYAIRLDNDVELFQILKKQLKPNCKHPKKFHDKDPDGNLYCMGCNLDL